jgi:hypothetical protein
MVKFSTFSESGNFISALVNVNSRIYQITYYMVIKFFLEKMSKLFFTSYKYEGSNNYFYKLLIQLIFLDYSD